MGQNVSKYVSKNRNVKKVVFSDIRVLKDGDNEVLEKYTEAVEAMNEIYRIPSEPTTEPTTEPTPSPVMNTYRNKRPPCIRVNICDVENSFCFKDALTHAEKTNKTLHYDYYKIYLKHMFGSCKKVQEKVKAIQELREVVSSKIILPSQIDKVFVRKTLNDNAYFYKSWHPGVIVKLFRTVYNADNVIIKAYIYDQHCDFVTSMIEERFRDEVAFQRYANQLHDKVDFISPKVYSWGKICRYKYPGKNCWFSCLYIIMEDMPHLTVKECNFSKETMKQMYKKVNELNDALTQEMLCHNDLNNGNIMIEPVSGKVILIDYGETRIGPTTPLFSNE